MRNLLNKSFTVKQILIAVFVMCVPLIYVYFYFILTDAAKRQYGSIAFRTSPYAKLVPSICRKSALFAVNSGPQFPNYEALNNQLKKLMQHDTLLLKPQGYIFSLSDSEKKLGFGMQGLPCMGFDFLMILHGKNFSKRDVYINEHGEVVATVTYEIIKPYKEPLPRESWFEGWGEITNSDMNDASLVVVPQK